MPQSNDLTQAEAERLAMLAEECSEVIQAVCKILRHGYNNYHPDRPDKTNRQELEKELQDVAAVIFGMCGNGDIVIDTAIQEIWSNKLKYTYNQKGIDNANYN